MPVTATAFPLRLRLHFKAARAGGVRVAHNCVVIKKRVMAKLGSEKRPVIVRVHSDEKARYVADTCSENGWHYIIGFEPDKPEDISDLEKLLHPSQQQAKSMKIDRNSSCPCGSGKKYKKCCANVGFTA